MIHLFQVCHRNLTAGNTTSLSTAFTCIVMTYLARYTYQESFHCELFSHLLYVVFYKSKHSSREFGLNTWPCRAFGLNTWPCMAFGLNTWPCMVSGLNTWPCMAFGLNTWPCLWVIDQISYPKMKRAVLVLFK